MILVRTWLCCRAELAVSQPDPWPALHWLHSQLCTTSSSSPVSSHPLHNPPSHITIVSHPTNNHQISQFYQKCHWRIFRNFSICMVWVFEWIAGCAGQAGGAAGVRRARWRHQESWGQSCWAGLEWVSRGQQPVQRASSWQLVVEWGRLQLELARHHISLALDNIGITSQYNTTLFLFITGKNSYRRFV